MPIEKSVIRAAKILKQEGKKTDRTNDLMENVNSKRKNREV